jgi:hypothetical protein
VAKRVVGAETDDFEYQQRVDFNFEFKLQLCLVQLDSQLDLHHDHDDLDFLGRRRPPPRLGLPHP